MTDGAGSGLPGWVDECADLLREYFDDAKYWQAAQDRAQREACDWQAQWQYRSEAGRAILACAWRTVVAQISPSGVKVERFAIVGSDARLYMAALEWWAVDAAEHIQPTMFQRWGDHLPNDARALRARRSQRAVEQALAAQRPGETMSEILARAGVSRQHGYRILKSRARR